MRPTSSPDAPAARGDRRRARTRQQLIVAARGFLQQPGYAERSIAEITDAADVGLGTFYNHFDSKDELYAAAVNEVLDEHGALLDAGRREGQDPAEALAITVRSTARLVLTNPEMAQILATQGMAILDSGSGLIPRAREVLKEAVSSGRFAHAEVEILLSAIVGALLGALHVWLRDPQPLDERLCDQLTERLLALCGLDPAEAAQLSRAIR